MPKREDAGAPRWPLEASLSTTACGSDQGAPPRPRSPPGPRRLTRSLQCQESRDLRALGVLPARPGAPGPGSRSSRPRSCPRLGAVGGREPAARERPAPFLSRLRAPPLPAETSGTRFPRGSAHLPAAGSRGLPRPDSQKTSDSSQTGGREHHVCAEGGKRRPLARDRDRGT